MQRRQKFEAPEVRTSVLGRRPARSIHNNGGEEPGADNVLHTHWKSRPPAFLSYANVQPNKEETMCRNEEEAERGEGEGRGRGSAASESVGLHPSADLWGLPMVGYLSVASPHHGSLFPRANYKAQEKVFASRGTSQGMRFAMRI